MLLTPRYEGHPVLRFIGPVGGDIALPLGFRPAEEPDEILACLQYAAALGPTLLATSGSTRRGALVVEGTDPDSCVVVEVGKTVVVADGGAPSDAVRLAGPSIALVEALSCRSPLPDDIAEDDRWLRNGLATAFDRVAAA